MSKLVILARDGVLNRDIGRPIADPADWEPIPGSLEAVARLNQAGYQVAVATNQPGLSQGSLDLDALNRIHHLLHDRLDRLGGHLVAIAFCPHSPEACCSCRKPAAGMYQQLTERFAVSAANTLIVGDRISDLEPAHAIGARAQRVRTGRLPIEPSSPDDDDQAFDDLAHLVSALLIEE